MDTEYSGSVGRIVSPRAQPAGVTDIALLEVVRTVWRGRRTIVATAIGVTLVVALALWRLTPLYTAEALLLLEAGEQKIANIDAVLQESERTDRKIPSEIEVLQSRTIASRVIDSLGLDRDPEFNPDMRAQTAFLDYFRVLLPRRKPAGGPDTAGEAGPTDEIAARIRRDTIVDKFLDRLKVKPKGVSWVVSVQFTSEDPGKSAQIANKIAEFYVQKQVQEKVEAARRATVWLEYTIAGLRRDVEKTERLVEEFREKSGLLRGDESGETLLAEQVSDLNSQIIAAGTARTEAEARLSQARRLIASGGAASAAEVLQAPLIRELRLQEAQLTRKYAELAATYGAQHPVMRNIEAERKDLLIKIDSEINHIIKGLENEVEVSKRREATLRSALDALKRQVAGADKSTVELRALEREAEANRTLLKNFLGRLKETSAQADQDAQLPKAQIISAAKIPQKVSFPNFLVILPAAFLGASILGVLLVFLLDSLDSGFRSGEQIKTLTGLPVLAMVPELPRRNGGPMPMMSASDGPLTAMFDEALGSLYTRLAHHAEGPALKSILFASSLPKEGKTTLAVCMAGMRALAGQRAIVVETDLRRPAVHTYLNMKREPGFGDVVAGRAQLEDVIVQHEATGAFVLPAGRVTGRPADLLASPNATAILDQLSRDFDLVVLDSPPIVAVADATMLARWADVTVFVVRWGKTTRETVRFGLDQFANLGIDITGVALSMVHPERHAEYGYGDSAHYYSAVRKYYGKSNT